MANGFGQVQALLGGFAAWQRAGLSVETAGGTPVP
jgi:3-mercaptopyruvate sulfurtransferase SseA